MRVDDQGDTRDHPPAPMQQGPTPRPPHEHRVQAPAVTAHPARLQISVNNTGKTVRTDRRHTPAVNGTDGVSPKLAPRCSDSPSSCNRDLPIYRPVGVTRRAR